MNQFGSYPGWGISRGLERTGVPRVPRFPRRNAGYHRPCKYTNPLYLDPRSLVHAFLYFSVSLVPLRGAPGAIYTPRSKEKRTNAGEPCPTFILASTAEYYGCEGRYFQCIDPSAACVDDDDVTAEMVEHCGYIWNIGRTGSALLFVFDRFRSGSA